MMRIYDTDTVYDMAEKIFNSFEALESVNIYGYVEIEGKLMEKGQAVLNELRILDEKANCSQYESVRHKGGLKRIRIYKFKPDSIGGPLAHKIFTHQRRIVDHEPRYTIWRFQ